MGALGAMPKIGCALIATTPIFLKMETWQFSLIVTKYNKDLNNHIAVGKFVIAIPYKTLEARRSILYESKIDTQI